MDDARRPPHVNDVSTRPWLQIVSGPDGDRVAAGVVAIADEFLLAGERVLVMDAGRRLGLHVVLEADARWGVGECLARRLPLLGVVQRTRVPGLDLLAHGAAARSEDWSQLGRVLDEARPYFGRCILALDPLAPRRAGETIMGRLQEAWWAGPAPLRRPAQALSERLGITLIPLALPESLPDALEALAARGDRTAAPVPKSPSAGPAAPAGRGADPRPAAVLDSDLRVRERLRFLLWVRGLNAPARGPILAAPARSR
jgi:hypothetical protein